MPTNTTAERTAYCTMCPSVSEVTEVLSHLGFKLVFQMRADDTQTYLHFAPLPAQFHYCDDHGTEVIYLSGVDQEDEQSALPHASRFWLYAGANALAQERVAQMLVATFALTWQKSDTASFESAA